MRIKIVFSLLLLLSISLFGSYPTNYDQVVEQATADVPAGATVSSNYYGIGGCNIAGTITGNAYLFGSEATISGEVYGNVFILGGSVLISGNVQGNVYIMSGQAILEGVIGGKVMFAGAGLFLAETGVVKGNVFAIAGNMSFQGTEEGDVTALASSFTVAGNIKKNLRTFVDRLLLTETAEIDGNLSYRSNHAAFITKGAKIQGKITHNLTILARMERLFLLGGGPESPSVLIVFFLKFLYTFFIGLMLMMFFPHKLVHALHALRYRTLSSFVWGLVALIGLPLFSVLLLITVVGAPFAVTLFALNIISFYTVTVFFIMWIANGIARKFGWKQNTMKELLIGQTVYYVLTSIPLVGALLAFVATTFGFGAAICSQTRKKS